MDDFEQADQGDLLYEMAWLARINARDRVALTRVVRVTAHPTTTMPCARPMLQTPIAISIGRLSAA